MPLGLEKLGLSVFVDGFKEFSKQTKEMGNSVDDLGDKFENVRGIDKWSKGLDKAGSTMMKVGGAMTAGLTLPIVGVAGAAVSAAASSVRYENALRGLAGGADQAAQYVNAIKGASAGAINSTDAMSYATRALTLDVVDNADQMRDLTQVAITLGRAQGMDAARSLNDLTVALGRQSPMILDNLGITMKLGEAYKSYAARLGKTESELTDMEKRQAFVTEALEKGRAVAERLGGVQEDVASQTESLQSQMHDLRVEMGKELLPVMTELMGTATKVVGKFTDMDAGTRKAIITIGGLAAAAGPATTALGAIVKTGGSLVGMIPDITFGLQAVTSGLGMAEVASVSTGAAIGGLVLPLTALAVAIGAAMFAIHKFMESEAAAAAKQHEVDVATGDYADTALRSAAAVDENTRSLVEASLVLDGIEPKVKALTTAQVEAVNALSAGQYSDYAEMAEHAADATEDMSEALGEVEDPADDAAEALDEVAEAAGGVKYSSSEMAKQFGKMDWGDWRKQAWNMALSLGLNSAELITLAKKLGIATDEEIKATVQVHKLAEGVSDGTLTVGEFAGGFGELAYEMEGASESERDLNAMIRDTGTESRNSRSNVRGLGNDVGGLAGAAGDAQGQMGGLRSQTEGAAGAAGVAGENYRGLGNDIKGYTDNVRKAGDETKRLSDYIHGMPTEKWIEVHWNIDEPAGIGPGLQTGTPYVPRTARYLLHRGEAVLNPTEAQAYRTQQLQTINNFNLTTQSITRPGTLRMEFEAMEVLTTR